MSVWSCRWCLARGWAQLEEELHQTGLRMGPSGGRCGRRRAPAALRLVHWAQTGAQRPRLPPLLLLLRRRRPPTGPTAAGSCGPAAPGGSALGAGARGACWPAGRPSGGAGGARAGDARLPRLRRRPPPTADGGAGAGYDCDYDCGPAGG